MAAVRCLSCRAGHWPPAAGPSKCFPPGPDFVAECFATGSLWVVTDFVDFSAIERVVAQRPGDSATSATSDLPVRSHPLWIRYDVRERNGICVIKISGSVSREGTGCIMQAISSFLVNGRRKRGRALGTDTRTGINRTRVQ